jgi:hypothetical protein
MVALGSDQTVDSRPRCDARAIDATYGIPRTCKHLPSECRRTGWHVASQGFRWSFQVDVGDHELSNDGVADFPSEQRDGSIYLASCACGWEGSDTTAADHARDNGLCGACWGSGTDSSPPQTATCPECRGVGTVEAQNHVLAAIAADGPGE